MNTKANQVAPTPYTIKVREVLLALAKRTYFNGSTDVVARKNKVIPDDTKLGEVQIDVEVDQALQQLERLVLEEVIGKSGKLKRARNAYYNDVSSYVENNKDGSRTNYSIDAGRARNSLKAQQRAIITNGKE